jgi:hypothetical protein
MTAKLLSDQQKIALADTYLKVVYDNLISPPFRTYADFINAVFKDEVTGEIYLDDRISLGQVINDYLAIIWKTKSGLNKIYVKLAKAAGSGKYPSKNAIWSALTKDISSISPLEYLKVSVVGTKVAVKSTAQGAIDIVEAGKEGLTAALKYAPYIAGIAAAGFLAFFVFKTKQLVKKP